MSRLDVKEARVSERGRYGDRFVYLLIIEYFTCSV